ncbi:hypothetical protein ABZ070_33310 [Streptomyces sp. NPDC006283]|uniref:hypothetical protein n=1 Tax=Streptomyces sp. NPDC006283 TaxID=3156741 RepID=UPI0033B10651
MSAIIADTGGLAFAEVTDGAVRRLHPIPWELTTDRSAVAAAATLHGGGLSIVARIAASNVPLLIGSADGTDLRPAPGIPGAQAHADVHGVSRDGTVLATAERRTAHGYRHSAHFLRPEAATWSDLEVPDTFRLLHVVGSDGDTVYLTGGAEDASEATDREQKPALFAADLSKGVVTEVGLPVSGPAVPLRDRLRWNSCDPAFGLLGRGTFHRNVLVTSSSHGHAFEYEVLHAVDRASGLWATARLRRDDHLAEQWVAADRTVHGLTGFGDLWTSDAGGAWRHTDFRDRLTRVLGSNTKSIGLQAAAFTGDRLLLATTQAVVECAADGTDLRILCRRDEGAPRVLSFLRPPAGTLPG